MQVHIVVGSKSDNAVAEMATKILDEFAVSYVVSVASAHRTPEVLQRLVKESDASVFIGIAGLSAALPGAIAAHTTRPVIGVPVSGKVNLDAVLSIVQMPPGIPVGGVGLDRGDNAALLAVQILAVSDAELQEKLLKYREAMQKKALAK